MLKLISKRVKEIYEQESRTNGLIIKSGYYGSKEHIGILREQGNKERFHLQNNEMAILDVTLGLMFYIRNSELRLFKQSKKDLTGFYDPCPGIAKQLYIEYSYRGRLLNGCFDDEEAIQIP